MTSRGVIMFAHNNTDIDYFRIAYVNALLIQKNLNVPITLITDYGTYTWALENFDENDIKSRFEKIIFHEKNLEFNSGNQRLFRDTYHHSKKLSFYNCNRFTCYELSPYDETLLIDCDYLILSDSLSQCWGSIHDVMINHQTQEAYFGRDPMPTYIDDFGIRLYWATVVYFRKSRFSQQLFSFIEHITKNYEYYKQLYALPRSLFRNDFAFSIAIHMINGFKDNGLVASLPVNKLLKVYETDDIHEVRPNNELVFYLEKPGETGNFILNKINGVDVHIMNKWSILGHFDKFMDLYHE